MSKQLFKGPGLGTSEWREAFTLTDVDGTTALFSIALDGTITAAGSFVYSGGNLSVSGGVDAILTASSTPSYSAHMYGVTSSISPAFTGFAARGTAASPTAVQSGDLINVIGSKAYGATGFSAASVGSLAFLAAENFTDTAKGTNFSLSLAPIGSVTKTTRLSISNAGAAAFTGTLAVSSDFAVATSKFTVAASSGNTVAAGSMTAAGFVSTGAASVLDISATTAGNAALKFTETSDTPSVAFTDDGTASHAPTTAPHGYLKVLVGSTPYYIPAWA